MYENKTVMILNPIYNTHCGHKEQVRIRGGGEGGVFNYIIWRRRGGCLIWRKRKFGTDI